MLVPSNYQYSLLKGCHIPKVKHALNVFGNSVRSLGQVANNKTEEVAKFMTVVTTVEMGNALYVNNMFFNHYGVFEVAGDRASFPLVRFYGGI